MVLTRSADNSRAIDAEAKTQNAARDLFVQIGARRLS
jgi:hypothetical protein